jgi:hypothetical protein
MYLELLVPDPERWEKEMHEKNPAQGHGQCRLRPRLLRAGAEEMKRDGNARRNCSLAC